MPIGKQRHFTLWLEDLDEYTIVALDKPWQEGEKRKTALLLKEELREKKEHKFFYPIKGTYVLFVANEVPCQHGKKGKRLTG